MILVDGVAVCELYVGFDRVKVLISISCTGRNLSSSISKNNKTPLSETFYIQQPAFYILIVIHLACDKIWCKEYAYSSEVIHYKSFPLWRVKSFIHSLMRLVIQGAHPDWWLIGGWCCVTHPTNMHWIHFGVEVTAIHLLCQRKQLSESLISLILPRCSGLDPAWGFSSVCLPGRVS